MLRDFRFFNEPKSLIDSRIGQPAFAIGRSQEIACVLKNHNFPYPVSIDGMALRTNDVLVKYQNYLRDPQLFNQALNSANIVNDRGERRKVVDNPGVIIAPAGMLVGGTAAFYKKIITKRPENGVALVSFQAPNTPGKTPQTIPMHLSIIKISETTILGIR